MSRTEGIPQRESGIVIPSVRLMDLIVGAVIRAVHIAEDGRGDHRVINSGIELHEVIRIISVHLDLGQFFVPTGNSFFMVLVEIIQRNFCLEILRCAFHADTRDSRIDQDLFVFLRIKIETGDVSGSDLSLIFCHDSSRIHMIGDKRLGETCLEINMLVRRPSLRETVSADSHRVDHLNIGVEGKVPVHRFLQVQEYRSFRFRKGITLDTATFGSRQLYINIIVLQQDTVITGRSSFFIMREGRINAQRSRSFFIRTGDRHKGDIIQISCPCTGKMGMAETGNRRIGIEIPGDTIPSRQSVVRTKLHHTIRSLCSRIGISGEIGTDHRVNILCIICLLWFLRRAGYQSQQGDRQ